MLYFIYHKLSITLETTSRTSRVDTALKEVLIMSTLSDSFLIEAYFDAMNYGLDSEFIELLFREIVRRRLSGVISNYRKPLERTS